LLQAAPGKFYAKPFGHGNAAQANVSWTPLRGAKKKEKKWHYII